MRVRERKRAGVTLIEMMMVVLIISLVAGLSFPSVTSGLDSIRMRSAADSVAAFLTLSANQVERREEPLELVFSRGDNLLAARGLRGKFHRELALPEGVMLRGVLPMAQDDLAGTRTILIFPGASVPQIGVVLENSRGQRRVVTLDPISGVARVEEPKQPAQ